MGLLFWRKTRDVGAPNPDQSVAASEDNPLPVQLWHPDGNDYPPFVVKNDYLPPVAGRPFMTPPQKVPGIGTGSAYTAGDAFGTLITFHNVFRPENPAGLVLGVIFWDLDDEGLQIDVPLYAESITVTTDNSPNAPSDGDWLLCRKVLSVSRFSNQGNNQLGEWVGAELVVANGPNLYTQLVVQGAANIAAGAEPYISLIVEQW